jgi:membrane protein
MGPKSADAIQSMIKASSKPSSGTLATIIGIGTLLVGASGVMTELKSALNRIWRATEPTGFKALIRDRLLSFGMVLAIGFLLLVSLVLSALISALGKFLGGLLPVPEFVLHLLDIVVSFGVVTLLFAMLYKALPNARVRWRDVWSGACMTALLFTIGKFGLGLYLGKGTVTSTYGAASSVLIILMWVYYSAQILYFGAEFTKITSENKLAPPS